MATAESFAAECRGLREVLNQGVPVSELDYRILRSNIVLLMADLERFGRPLQASAEAFGFMASDLRSTGPEAA